MNMCLLYVPMRAKTLQVEECGSSARRTVDIGLDISLQHLSSDAVDPGFIPGINLAFLSLFLSILPPRWRTR